MILFGAGASTPFDIPIMSEYTSIYKERCNKQEKILFEEFKTAIEKSPYLIGYNLPFDMETLLSLLNDLSNTNLTKPVSVATSSFLISNKITVFEAREKYQKTSNTMLLNLKDLIFKECMNPIEYADNNEDSNFLNDFYGPLFTVLNRSDISHPQWNREINYIYTTNWDICLKRWLKSFGHGCIEGMIPSRSGDLTLNAEDFIRKIESALHNERAPPTYYVSLHGSLDWFENKVPKRRGYYKEIGKLPDPISYYKYKDNLNNMFIIYPLEATGYEETIKSPYLDMLYVLGETIKTSTVFYSIGYSMRDPTISSIIEDRINKKMSEGDIEPLPDNLENRLEEASNQQFKFIIMTQNSERLKNNLEKRGQKIISQTFVPIEVSFPKLIVKNENEVYLNPNFKNEYSESINKILNSLQIIFKDKNIEKIKSTINEQYGMNL